ncbi:methionyl-tRNA formyltransferase [Ulvibacter sp. MAR_2010_11]|uniref:methionyl-tRNA formyltransferase n=1 Tax=Ulvibacter sp. MAR_2010_11 TaxID=1250229 RepID=UPI000C2C3A63|nr:methionyl-tRNA formyltransferase [Ulvibacter sp. MAR_2010_11]PKA83981.1 methionyl-tRNA formyltransferase [Ulvibacter sp. MAR_2010_11]
MRDIRIVFMGTPDFAVGVLQKLVEADKHIVGVITSPDKPAGRGQKLRLSAVKEYALSQNLTVLQPTNLKDEGFLTELKALHANLQIVVAFRMLPKVVWAMPEYGTFNLHASLLPQYRGAAPINWAIINGETKTGVTTFFIDEKIDTGEIILTSETEVAKNETVGTLHDKLMHLGSELVVETVALLEKGQVATKSQPQTAILKEAPKLTPENTQVDWSQSAETIDAFVRGLSPFPVAWTVLQNEKDELKVKIFQSSPQTEAHTKKPGTIIASKKSLKVATGNGYLYIKEMQLPGKRKMAIGDLLNGYTFTEDAKML